MSKQNIHFAYLFALAVMLNSTTIIAEDKIYRIKDEAGNTIFTDKPPAQTDNKATENIAEIIINEEESNIADSEKTVQQNHPEWLKEAQEKREKQQQANTEDYQVALQSWKEKLKEAKKNVANAENQLADAEIVKEGDFIGFANQSGARPSYQYLKRVENLTEALVGARKHLESVKNQKPHKVD